MDAYEVLIVGGGKAGKTLAADLARAGRRVALVERGMIGGTCINVGCIPTKALVKSAKVAESAARASDFGIRIDQWKTDMSGVMAHKRRVVEGMVALNSDNLHSPSASISSLVRRVSSARAPSRCGPLEERSGASRATSSSSTSVPSRRCRRSRVSSKPRR